MMRHKQALTKSASEVFLPLRGERDVKVGVVKQQRPLGQGGGPVGLLQQLEQARADVHGNAHDDALGHACKWERKTSSLGVGVGGGQIAISISTKTYTRRHWGFLWRRMPTCIWGAGASPFILGHNSHLLGSVQQLDLIKARVIDLDIA